MANGYVVPVWREPVPFLPGDFLSTPPGGRNPHAVDVAVPAGWVEAFEAMTGPLSLGLEPGTEVPPELASWIRPGNTIPSAADGNPGGNAWAPAFNLLNQYAETAGRGAPSGADAYNDYLAWQESLMGNWDNLLSGQPGSGGYGGGLTAQEAAERELRVRQMLEEMELGKAGIRRDYDPYLRKTAAEIALERKRAGEDAGIYERALAAVPHSFAASGRLTDEFYEKAARAVATQDSDARAKIDASFAGARGRVQAMILSVSRQSPEMATQLGRGMDEIREYIQSGMASDKAGWDAVLAASNQLAQATLVAASAGMVGEHARASRRLVGQYQNTIEDMLIEERRIKESRDNALAQFEEERRLEIDQLREQWALADAARATGGGGASRRQVSEELFALLDSGYSRVAVVQGSLSTFMDRWDVTENMTEAEKYAAAEAALLAEEYNVDTVGELLTAIKDGTLPLDNEAAASAAQVVAFFESSGSPALLVATQALREEAGRYGERYDSGIRNPGSSLPMQMAAARQFALEHHLDPDEVAEWVLGQGGGSMNLGSGQALFALRYGSNPTYAAQLAQETSPAALQAALGGGFSSPLGGSGTARTPASPTWVGGPGNF